jgi:hypothetical protein
MHLSFASGAAWGIPSGSNPTPSRLRQLQDWSLDFTRTTKQLYSLNTLPNAIGIATTQIKGKAKLAQLSGRMANDLFFSGTSATGQTLTQINEGPTAIPTTPFQITVVNGATFTRDLGVINSVTGVPFTEVASAPAAGQYAVNPATGVYTFASADNVSGVSVRISYNWTTTGGQTVTVANQAMGVGPTFKSVLSTTYNGLGSTWVLNASIGTKFAVATQLEDFMKPDFEWDAYTDSTDTLGTISFAELN